MRLEGVEDVACDWRCRCVPHGTVRDALVIYIKFTKLADGPMEGDMTWVGLKTLAFIPLSRTAAQPPDIMPPDWTDQIMQRVFFDPSKDSCLPRLPGEQPAASS